MNILYINHYAGSKKHGMAFRPYYLSKEWIKTDKNKVTVVASSYSHLRNIQPNVSENISYEIIDGIKYTWIKTIKYKSNGIKRFINILQFIFKLFLYSNSYIKYNKPDIVIASSTYPMDIWPAYFIAKKSKAPLIFELHDVWPQSLIEAGGLSKIHPFVILSAIAEKSVYKLADRIVSMLPAIHEHCKYHNYDLSKVTVIPNGIDMGEWVAPDKSLIPSDIKKIIDLAKIKNQRILCYTGAHGIPNDLDNLLDAAKNLKNAPVIFLLIGDGNHKKKLSNRIKAECIDNIYMFDSVPKEIIPSILNFCDIAFIGARNQPLYRFGISPNKLMDYMMSSTPIISAIDAGNDPVTDANCGVSIPPQDSLMLSEAIKSLCALSKEELSKMGSAGRKYAIENYEYSNLAEKFMNVIKEQK